jgi:hypothetical protein
MAHRVTKRKGKYTERVWKSTPNNWHSGGYNEDVERNVTVFHVSADTFSELISAIDQIDEDNLTWFSPIGNLGIEGMPMKSNGKWKARLKIPWGLKRKSGKK